MGMIGGANLQSIAAECKRRRRACRLHARRCRRGKAGYAGPGFAIVGRRCLPHSTAIYSGIRLIAAQGTMRHDRPLLLDHAERPQDHDLSRGGRAPLQDHPGEHRQGRAVQGRVPGGLSRTTASRPWSIMRRPAAASRSRCSSRAPSCSISPRRPASSCRAICAPAPTPSNGCSGRWAISARWPARTITSATTRWRRFPYAMDRYRNEVNRLYGVLNKRLADRAFVAGDYSIADMAIYPWIVPYERQGQKLEDFPHLKRWFEAIRARPAVERAYEKAKAVNPECGRHPHRRKSARSCSARPRRRSSAPPPARGDGRESRVPGERSETRDPGLNDRRECLCLRPGSRLALARRIAPERERWALAWPGHASARSSHARCGIFGRSPLALPVIGGRGSLAAPGSMTKVCSSEYHGALDVGRRRRARSRGGRSCRSDGG